MTINSPREALEAILTYCVMPLSPLAAPMTDAHRHMADTIAVSARAGLAAPTVHLYGPLDMMPSKAGGVGDALEQIRVAANEPGRHYLPSPWVRAMAQQGLEFYRTAPPAPQHDPRLVRYALAYLDLVHSGDAGQLLAPTEFAEMSAFLDPLRPLPPVPENIAAMLTQAREEQVIDGQQLDELRDLARRMAK